MIVDVHTHTPRYRVEPPADASVNAQWRPDQSRSVAHTWQSHLDAMAGVDRAICFNIASDPRLGEPDDGGLIYAARQANDDTAAFVQAFPEKFIGFLTVHPHDPAMLDEIERATGDLGLRGIKLGPNYQNFDPLGAEAFRLFERAEALGLPVLLHQGTSPNQFADIDYAHPRHIDRVAIAFPRLKIVLAHIGHPWQIDCIAVIRKHPNLFADVSAQFYRPWSAWNAFRLATEWGVLDKLLFGSDYPIAAPDETMRGLRHVNDPIRAAGLPLAPEEQMEAIIHRNSLELLGLE